jgi:hypothetical protein
VDSRNNSRYLYDPRVPLHQNPYVYIGAGDNADVDQQFVKLKVNGFFRLFSFLSLKYFSMIGKHESICKDFPGSQLRFFNQASSYGRFYRE